MDNSTLCNFLILLVHNNTWIFFLFFFTFLSFFGILHFIVVKLAFFDARFRLLVFAPFEGTFLNVLLAVVPSTTGVRSGESDLDTRGDDTSEHSTNEGVADQPAEHERREDNNAAGSNHLLERLVSRDFDTSLSVRVFAFGLGFNRLVGLSFTPSVHIFLIEDVFAIDYIVFGNYLHCSDLVSDFTNHVLSSIADSLHCESSEGIGKHSTEEETSEGVRLKDVNVERSHDLCEVGTSSGTVSLFFSDTGDVGTEESESDQASRADSETFTNSGGSVTCSVEGIGDLTDFIVKHRHLSNTTGVIRDRAVSIDREADGEATKHTESSESNTVHSSPLECEEHSHGEAANGNDAGHVAESETIDNVGGSTVEAGLGEASCGRVRVGGVVFSCESDNEA